MYNLFPVCAFFISGNKIVDFYICGHFSVVQECNHHFNIAVIGNSD